ncbi:MAG: ribosome silencing factor [Prevotella sp.]|nr:ribosome silencing factor [Prevotella sp.]MCD8306570.1 ribosome silencing factor [Prevotella sp.]
MAKTEKLVETIIKAIQEKKGHNIVVADLSAIEGAIARFFIICEGNSPTQTEAVAGEISDYCRKTLGEKPAHCVGLENAVWVAIDFVDVMVHVFVPETRAFYDLEHLWNDAAIRRIPDID